MKSSFENQKENKRFLILNFGTFGAPLILAVIYLMGDDSIVKSVSMALSTVLVMYLIRLSVLDPSDMLMRRVIESFKDFKSLKGFIDNLKFASAITGLFAVVLSTSIWFNHLLIGTDNVVRSIFLSYNMFIGYNVVAYLLTIAIFDPIIYFTHKLQKNAKIFI